PITQSQSLPAMVSIAPARETPALLQRTCTRPNSRKVLAAASASASRSETSQAVPIAAMPSRRSISTALAQVSGSMSAIATFMPRPPKARAIAKPMPPAPPVMNALLPKKSFMVLPAPCSSRGPDLRLSRDDLALARGLDRQEEGAGGRDQRRYAGTQEDLLGRQPQSEQRATDRRTGNAAEPPHAERPADAGRADARRIE